MLAPEHMNLFQWHEAQGIARQVCARIFRDGGSPADAMATLGVRQPGPAKVLDWAKAVELAAEHFCRQPLRRAA